MTAEHTESQEFEVSNPILGKFVGKGMGISGLVGLLTFVVAIGSGVLVWNNSVALGAHKAETAQSNTALTGAIKDLAQSQRLMTCIISQPQDRREREFGQENSLCQRMSRLP